MHKPCSEPFAMMGRALAATMLVLVTGAAGAQQAKPVKQPSPNPLDTIMNSHLWADVPEAKDFVRSSRPPSSTLDYKPFTAQVHDVERPKTRDAAGLKGLEQELDHAQSRNKQAGSTLNRAPKPGE